MDDTTIYTAVPDAADTVIGTSGGIVTGSSIRARQNSIKNSVLSGASSTASTSAATVSPWLGVAALSPAEILRILNSQGFEFEEAPEPPKPEAKPKKPPPAICPEAWHSGEFDADRAWQATIAACKGVR